VASSTFGRWPLRGGARFARAAIPRPGAGHDGSVAARAIGDYLFGPDAQPPPAELASNRIPDAGSGGFNWTLVWHTDVMAPRDGSAEQRVPTITRPRQVFAGGYLLDAADTRDVRQFLVENAAGTFALPLVHEAVAAIVAITGGTIYVDPTYCDWIEIGRQLYVRGPAGHAYTTTITGSSGGAVNVSSSPPVGGRFPAGLTLIYPLEEIRLEDGQTLSRFAVNAASWSFAARAASRAQPGAGTPAATVFDGYRVLDRRPYQEKRVAEVVHGGVQFLDNGNTMTSATSLARAKIRRLGQWRIDSPADRQWMKAFVTERRGKHQPYLFPTWHPDLVLHEQPTAGAAFIRVTSDYIAKWYPSLAHRRLQMEYADRSVTHHYVHSTAQASGYQELTLVPTLANPIPAGGVTRVSFLETSRLDSDEVTFEYGSGAKGKVTLPALVVQESKTRTFAWPGTAAALRSAFGYGTWANAWGLNEATLGVADSIGGVVLSPTGTPIYRAPGPLLDDFAVRFANGTTDAFVAPSTGLFDLGTAGSLAVYLSIRFTSLHNRFIFSKYNGGTGWGIQFQSAPTGQVIGNVNPVFFSTVTADHWQSGAGNWHDLLLVIDRESPTPTLQTFTELGAGSPTDISAAGNINVGVPARLGGNGDPVSSDVSFMAVATGGIASLRANAAAAIANMRRYTGRA
jgi:hypothetical protein